VQSSADGHEIVCAPANLHAVAAALIKRFGDPGSTKLVWKPRSSVPVGEDDAQTLFNLFNALDDNDDVQSVSANYEIAEETMERLTA
jgi:transcriptional/translational regulatory protein YebC/TACO1